MDNKSFEKNFGYRNELNERAHDDVTREVFGEKESPATDGINQETLARIGGVAANVNGSDSPVVSQADATPVMVVGGVSEAQNGLGGEDVGDDIVANVDRIFEGNNPAEWADDIEKLSERVR